MIKNNSKSILLKNARLYDPFSNSEIIGSVFIEDGLIKDIGEEIVFNKAKEINCENKIVTAGFIDVHAHFREPGREDKETLQSGSIAAFCGGYTRVCVMPNTNPPLDSPESIRYIIQKSLNLPVKIYPIGAITVGQKGEELTEIGKMVDAGAIGISDDGIPVQNGQMMRYAIQYAQKYNVPVINHAEDIYLRNNGVMNESLCSTSLGLPGIPDISESVMVHRDLEIAEFCSGRLHIPHVSTRKSVELIKKYKALGVNVTSEVTPHHIGLTEKKLIDYDTSAKVAPPLRSESDRDSLINALKDGTIDCIATDHAPHTTEEKEMDFLHAPCGMIGLESAFGLSHTILRKHEISTKKIIQWFTSGPASVLGLTIEPFKLDSNAELVIVDPNKKWTFSKSDIKSRSKNSPMLGMNFKGKVIAGISGNYTFGL